MGEGEFFGEEVRGEGEVAGGVVIEEEGWGEVEGAVGDEGGFEEMGEACGGAERVGRTSHWGARLPCLGF